MPAPAGSELMVGLVGPIGVDLAAVSNAVKSNLIGLSYVVADVRFTDVFQGLQGNYLTVPAAPADQRLHHLMELGNKLCDDTGTEDAMARLGVFGINKARGELGDAPRKAFILRQLKRPAEVTSLRRLYGEHFVLIAAVSPAERRVDKLSELIATSEHDMDPLPYRDRAYGLVKRDEDEERTNGQKMRDTFWRADLFVDPTDPASMNREVQRFVELLFGRVISAPTIDEFAMFSAWGSAMRSASLARQVGAVIFDDRGSIIATGTNDVARARGGVYWEGDEPDGRDHRLGGDQSDARRRDMVAQVLAQLKSEGWLSNPYAERDPGVLAEQALAPGGVLRGTRAAGVMEYVRAVHAEQCAITDASRRGVATQGARLAVTTFPCHECARLIVAAGISELTYVEPYPKSLAERMYGDSISFQVTQPGKVLFRSFLGVAPGIYERLFSAQGIDRKHPDGSVKLPTAAQAQLRLTYQGSRLQIEDAEAAFQLPIVEMIDGGPGQ